MPGGRGKSPPQLQLSCCGTLLPYRWLGGGARATGDLGAGLARRGAMGKTPVLQLPPLVFALQRFWHTTSMLLPKQRAATWAAAQALAGYHPLLAAQPYS